MDRFYYIKRRVCCADAFAASLFSGFGIYWVYELAGVWV